MHTLYQIASSLGIIPDNLLPASDGDKPIKITSRLEIGTKTKKKLEKIISDYDKKEVKLVE